MSTFKLVIVLVISVMLVGLVAGLTTAGASPMPGVGEDEVEVKGTISDLSLMPDGTGWIVVNGMKILIDHNTEIDEQGTLAVGVEVDVDAVAHDGMLLATQIELESGSVLQDGDKDD